MAVSVESPRRQGLRLHHTGTHLLHAALRKVLGTHVTQAGSLVAPDRLRFDFTHAKPVKDRDLEQVEDLVNEAVRENITVDPFWTDLDAALKMGAMALFGEKYGNHVRVIRIGDFSTELCGGTHLDATGQIGLFKVTTEGAVASGVRRLEAVTGHAPPSRTSARKSRRSARRPTSSGSRRSSCRAASRSCSTTRRDSRSSSPSWRRASRRVGPRTWSAGARSVAGIPVVVARLDGLDADGLRAVVDSVRERLALGRDRSSGAVTDGKVNLVSAVTKDLTARVPRRQADPGGREGRGRRRRRPARPRPGRREESRRARSRAGGCLRPRRARRGRLTGRDAPAGRHRASEPRPPRARARRSPPDARPRGSCRSRRRASRSTRRPAPPASPGTGSS